MLKLIRIQCDNFRSLYEFDLPINSLSILIGKNDSGKSNVLRAIQLLLDDKAISKVKAEDWSKLAKQHKYPRHISITGFFHDDQSKITVKRVITIHGQGKKPTSIMQIQAEYGWRLILKSEKDLLPSFYYLRPRTGALQESLDPNKENNLFSLVKVWMPSKLKREASLHKLMRQYAKRKYGAGAITNLKAYVKFIENEVENNLIQAFSSDFDILKLAPDFRGGNELILRELNFGDKRARIRLPLNYHGTALISIIAIVYSIAILEEFQIQQLKNRPMIVAIEEPEVHLHPEAQRTLLNYIRNKSKKQQILTTTHSSIFVDRSQPENVILLRRTKTNGNKDNNQTVGATTAVSKAYSDNWMKVSTDLGIKLSDILMAGEIALLVEGQSEAVIIPAIANKLLEQKKPSIDFDRITVIIGGGASLPHKIVFFQALKTPIFALVDNDKSGREIKKTTY